MNSERNTVRELSTLELDQVSGAGGKGGDKPPPPPPPPPDPCHVTINGHRYFTCG